MRPIIKKRLTIGGRSYTVKTRSCDDNLNISGPGLVGGLAMVGHIDDPDLRAKVAAAVERQRANNRAASELIQERVKAGTAGIGKTEELSGGRTRITHPNGVVQIYLPGGVAENVDYD